MAAFREETSVILLLWDRFSVLSDWGSAGPAAHALSVYCGLGFPFWPFSTHLPCFSDDSHLLAPSLLLSDAFFPCCSHKCPHLTDGANIMEAGMCQLHREQMRLVMSQAS